MLALDNLIFREREFVWMDCQLLLRESWKVLRDRRLLISFKDNYGEKVTQSVSKKTSYVVVGQDLGESKLSKVHCNAQLTTGKEKKSTMNTNIEAAPFSLNFYYKSGVWLTVKSLRKLATNLHKLTQFIDDNNEIS